MLKARICAFLIVLTAAVSSLSAGGSKEKELLIDVKTLTVMIADPGVLVLDIRDEVSYSEGHIPGAILLTTEALSNNRIPSTFLRFSIVTYCSCPHEESSIYAALTLRGLGVTNVHVLKGGYAAWIASGQRVEL